jgi:hypothetical protein
MRRRLLLALALAAGLTAPMAAQGVDSVRIAAGPQYGTSGPLGWLNRWLFGSRYRALWSAPVSAPLIDTVGTLLPVGADSGLREGFRYFRDTSRMLWTFRPLDRELETLLSPSLRRHVVTGTFQDLVSARHPGAPLVVPELALAAGVRLPAARLAAFPDTGAPSLGVLEPGIVTPYLDRIVPGSRTITSAELLERLRQPDAGLVDVEAYLRDRLFDVYLGHWDYEPEEWPWTRGTGDYWVPRPRARDGAFARFDGLLTALAAQGRTEASNFGERYSGRLGVTTSTLALDRRLLTGVGADLWNDIAAEIRLELTDSVIAEAVRSMPEAYYRLNGARLERQLRARRDALPEAARQFRAIVMDQAEVYGTTGADTVLVDRLDDYVISVSLGGFTQQFITGETRSIAVFLRGGADRVEIRGSGRGGPWLDIAAEAGAEILDQSGIERTTVHVPEGTEVTLRGALAIRRRTLEEPIIGERNGVGPVTTLTHAFGALPWLSFNSDIGLLAGLELARTTHAPGYDPWRKRFRLRGGYATSPAAFVVGFRGEWLPRTSRGAFHLDAMVSAVEVLKYYGLGNETVRDREDDYYKADQRHLTLTPSVAFPLSRVTSAQLGVALKYVDTRERGERLILDTRPYGSEGFGQVGLVAAVRVDTRDSPIAPKEGALLTLDASVHPQLWDVEDDFGRVRLSAAGHLTPGSFEALTLSARVTGERAWGRYPIHEAAFLGGSRSVRSLKSQRFAGDAAAFANLDLRLRLATLHFVMPWDFGLLGIADAGRVWLSGETSRRWHHGFGGGLWMALPDRSFMGIADVVTGEDGTAFWLGTAFIF